MEAIITTPTLPDPLATLPAPFLQRMEALLGDDYTAFLEHLGRPARSCLRVNTLKVAPEHIQSLLSLRPEPLPWCPQALLLPPELRLGRHPLHSAGLYYLQDPSATAAVPLLDPQPGERVLDLCAAPGGKATHIAARLRGQGLLWANEIIPARARVLAENLERWGVRNAVISVERPGRLAERLPGYFDRVLLDVPCSGEGLFRRDPASARSWSPAAVQGCARRQAYILEDAAHMVRPGGVLLYATCTFAPEENEGVVGQFLAAHPDFCLEAGPSVPSFAPGRPDWVPALPPETRAQLSRTLRLWPHRLPGEGHFLARLRRGEAPPPAQPSRWRPPTPSGPEQQLWTAFLLDTLPGLDGPADLVLFGEQLYALIPDLPDPAGLRLLRPGWSLGRLRQGRFIPGHALALAVEAAAASERLELDLGDAAVAAYLRGETLSSAGKPGWLLLTVAGFPLGWGKRVGTTVKNHLPKRLRVGGY